MYMQVWAICQGLLGFILMFCIMPESPKWLYSQGRYKECLKAMKLMAKINRVKETPLIDKWLNKNLDKFEDEK